MRMVMTSDKLKYKCLRIGQRHHAKRLVAINLEYHVVVAIRRLRTDKNSPAENTWPKIVKNEQHIGSKKIYGPKIKLNTNDTRYVFFLAWSADLVKI